jgi:hypothetical protein
MADEIKPNEPPKGANKNEVALELMKFIAVSTGYGKGNSNAGFAASKGSRTSEEQADALIELFERCRKVIAAGD